mmetsp:Transcript_43072/g.85316  ORF Transcript_43072/g.85316 Transcript_43072/m.85316 type:complete len:203 (-) Transcript_43072:92-700(-)
MREEVRHFILIQQLACLRIVFGARLKEVKWAVIMLMLDVVHKVFELHAKLPAIIVLANLKRRVPHPLEKFVDSPFLHGRPIVHCTFNDTGPLRQRKLLEKRLNRDVTAPHSWNRQRLRLDRTSYDLISKPSAVAILAPFINVQFGSLSSFAPIHLLRCPTVVENPRNYLCHGEGGRCAVTGMLLSSVPACAPKWFFWCCCCQ